ncbi:MAG: IPT/TIG domain-containing protein, partial [Acidobacteriota bacterium]|nr:IPT/TIG domain-containing protein [Acidobacteriota bacterium]
MAYAAPSITGASPNTGPIGIQVQISGSGFGTTQGTSTVMFNGQAAGVTTWSDAAIAALVPTGATSGPISVTVNGQTANGPSFTVIPLPSGWSHTDIGSVGLAGSATYASGIFTVKGAGAGSSGTADAIHLAYQSLSGDGSIVARVASLQGGDTNRQIGVMIRESLSANSTSAFVYFRPNLAFLTTRTSTGASASSQSTSFASASAPYWVKLVRTGNVFTAFISTGNGSSWTQVGTPTTIAMAQNVYIGLAVSSASTGLLATATFDNVSINSAVAPAPVITGLSATTGSIGSQVTITGSNLGSGDAGSLVLLNGSAVTINNWTSTQIVFTVPSGSTSGLVVVLVGPTMNASNPVYFAVTSQPLPIPWLDLDIGAVGMTGSATYANNAFTVKGEGLGSTGTADGIHFAYQSLSGDGSIVTRVTSLQGGSVPQVGVMIRETLSANSTEAFVYFRPSLAFLTTRATTGASASSQTTSFASASAPYWVKLV